MMMVNYLGYSSRCARRCANDIAFTGNRFRLIGERTAEKLAIGPIDQYHQLDDIRSLSAETAFH